MLKFVGQKLDEKDFHEIAAELAEWRNDSMEFSWLDATIKLRNLGLPNALLIDLSITVDHRDNSKKLLKVSEGRKIKVNDLKQLSLINVTSKVIVSHHADNFFALDL